MKKFFLILSILIGFSVLTSFLGYWSFKSWVSQKWSKPFSEEKIETQLKSYLAEIQGVQKIQLAELKQLEKLTRTSERKILWQKLKLPSVVVSVEAPVNFTYYVDLKKPWSMQELNPGNWQVITSPLEFNQPAVDVSSMEVKVEKSSLLRNEKPIAQKLISELSGFLDERAEANKALVRESARKQLHDLIQKWLRLQNREGRIEVLFPDEVSVENSSGL